ncbi:ATP-binding protein [Phycisphaeraceae bacterium D3-23]
MRHAAGGRREVMGESTTKSWVIPSTLTHAVDVLKHIVSAVEDAGYRREAVFAIRLALDEALANAVKHGNDGDESKTVTVEMDVNAERAIISVEDQGEGFIPCDLPDPTADENLSRPCGRGVMLMNAYMTHVTFSESGNRVTLTKTYDCKLPHG